MKDTPKAMIGFDRKIDLAWLDAAAGRLATGQSEAEVRAFLWSLLNGAVAGETTHSARGKTLTILTRLWLTVPPKAQRLRDAALSRIPAATVEERLALHWAMSLASYPFFCEVAASLGKLLALHGQASLAQVSRRMTETWGDRSTLPRALQRVLRSMMQWGALRESGEKGTYAPLAQRIPIANGTAALLIQAVLVSQGHGMGLAQASKHAALFPFEQ